ncbi:MAG: ABC transporter substrate-binding protein [Candidatus Hydrothermales bacterium]
MFLLNQTFSFLFLFLFSPKIISLAPSVTDFLIELNLSDYVVGKTYLDPDYIKADIVLSSSLRVSKEKIYELKPTHIISAGLVKEEELIFFKKRGIKVFDIKYESILDVIETYLILGKEFKVEELSLRKLKVFLDTLFIYKDTKEKKKVLFVLDLTNGVFCPGRKTFISDLINWVGFKNYSDFFDGYGVISLEKLVYDQPDIIIFNFKNSFELVKNTPIKKLKATRDKKIYEVKDPDHFSRPSPLLIKGLKFLSQID